MTRLQAAAEELRVNDLSCVVFDDEGKWFSSYDKGVKPLMDLLKENKEAIRGKYVADKIIGKAAACLMVYGGAKACFGRAISESAIQLFEQINMPYQYDVKVGYIENRDKTGVCPMEQTVLTCETAEEGFLAVSEFIRKRDMKESEPV